MMYTTLSSHLRVDPFSKIELEQQPDGRVNVRAHILMEHVVEQAETGLAIDGSGTMMPWFGVQRRGSPNVVSPFVQQMCTYLAQKLDVDGCVSTIYWAAGDDGSQIEEIGSFTADTVQQHTFRGPKVYGKHTVVMPAIRYFVDKFAQAPWGMYVFITDGRIEDLDDVKKYTKKLAQDIAAGRRNRVKLIMVGVGHRVDESQMEVLDRLNTNTGEKLWDHKVAKDMRNLAEVFTDVVDEQVIVAPHGQILDGSGNLIKDYRDVGVPALLKFTLPAGTSAFQLQIGENSVLQPIA